MDLARPIRVVLRMRVMEILRQDAAFQQKELSLLGGDVARLRLQVQDLARKVDGVVQRLDRRPITSKMTVHEVWRRHLGVAEIFASYGLPACLGCAVGGDETLEEAALGERLPLKDLLFRLNRLISCGGG